jgi:Holliday junction resolvase RusA-like endonuclease
MDHVDFFAPGIPSTKGSARAFVVNGRAIVTNDAGKKAKAWASIVAGAASEAMGSLTPFGCAVDVTVVFFLPRPKAHSRSNGELKADAPRWSPKKPDADKLARCALDALTGVVFVDDSQIARLLVEKRYADGQAGAHVLVRPISTAGAAEGRREAAA